MMIFCGDPWVDLVDHIAPCCQGWAITSQSDKWLSVIVPICTSSAIPPLHLLSTLSSNAHPAHHLVAPGEDRLFTQSERGVWPVVVVTKHQGSDRVNEGQTPATIGGVSLIISPAVYPWGKKPAQSGWPGETLCLFHMWWSFFFFNHLQSRHMTCNSALSPWPAQCKTLGVFWRKKRLDVRENVWGVCARAIPDDSEPHYSVWFAQLERTDPCRLQLGMFHCL